MAQPRTTRFSQVPEDNKKTGISSCITEKERLWGTKKRRDFSPLTHMKQKLCYRKRKKIILIH